VATEFGLINLSMANFNIHKCDETDLKEYLPNITQAISNKTGLLDATASEHALMAHLQRAMIVSLSVIAPQNNAHYFVTGCQVKSSITMQFCRQCLRGNYLVLHNGRLAAQK